MSAPTVITGARIFDGWAWRDGRSLLVEAGRIRAIVTPDEIPARYRPIDAEGQLLVPGFVDLQVNGGGGELFNERPDVESIRAICAAHAKFGSSAVLPTLITDRPETTRLALAAGREARAQGVPGFAGMHLEGPHISLARKGAHDPALIRPMKRDDLEMLVEAAAAFGVLLVTLAPENVTAEEVRVLTQAGIVVSLGHTDCDHATALRYVKAGASMVTHLFNAMSPLRHREPGLVGAALTCGGLSAGLIADGVHVDPAAAEIALRAKRGPGRIFLVTDAMSPLGTGATEFMLNGRTVLRREGRLTLTDGTLAGADIDMLASVRFVHERMSLPLEEALRMASTYPAEAIRMQQRKGALCPGMDADFVLLTPELDILSTWIGGRQVFAVE